MQTKNTKDEFSEPKVTKKRRAAHTTEEIYAGAPNTAIETPIFANMSEVEARRWLNEETKKVASYKVSPRLKDAFKQAVDLKGMGSVNGALNAYMTDVVMSVRDRIDL